MSAPAEGDLRHCAELLQERDRTAWLSALLMPPTLRDATLVLRAFHCELTAIARTVVEPMAGEIRLQWWADIVAGNRAEEAAGHPVARALVALIEANNLPRQVLNAKIAAHIFDLYADPMGSREMFEGYAGETRSVLYQLAWLCAEPEQAPERADASGHAGVAETVADVLRHLTFSLPRQRLFIPEDLLSSAGFDAATFLAATPEARAPVVAGFADYGLDHLLRARAAIGAVEQAGNGAHLAYLPLATLEPVFQRARSKPVEVQQAPPRFSQIRAQWRLWRAARSGRV